MHHVKQSDIAVELRRPHIREARHKLQEALRYATEPAQRRFLQHQLDNLGKPRTYSSDDPLPPNAIDNARKPITPVKVTGDSFESLSRYRFSELARHAEDLGIPVPEPTTKAQIVKLILSKGELP